MTLSKDELILLYASLNIAMRESGVQAHYIPDMKALAKRINDALISLPCDEP